jgi:hypothetical protein
MRVLVIVFILMSFTAVGQLDTIQEKILACNDSMDIQILRLTLQDNHTKYNDYYVINNYHIINEKREDSLLFKHIQGDYPEYLDTAYLDFKQLNRSGSNELILEYEYSGSHTYTGYHRRIIIVDLDSLNVMFSMEIEAMGQHFFGEELGDHYGFRYDISFENRDIIIRKPIDTSGNYTKERFVILEGQYVIKE